VLARDSEHALRAACALVRMLAARVEHPCLYGQYDRPSRLTTQPSFGEPAITTGERHRSNGERSTAGLRGELGCRSLCYFRLGGPKQEAAGLGRFFVWTMPTGSEDASKNEPFRACLPTIVQ